MTCLAASIKRYIILPQPDFSDRLYVYERDSKYPAGRLSFVAALSNADRADWAQDDDRRVQATADGQFLVFESSADLTPGDTSSEPQVFEYDATNEQVSRVSVGASDYAEGEGHADALGAAMGSQAFREVDDPSSGKSNLAITEDGRVIFTSQAALTEAAVPAEQASLFSVYEYYREPDGTGNVALISDGVHQPSQGPISIVGSGSDIVFDTDAPLVPSDADTQIDVYDVRAYGGSVVGSHDSRACEGEACLEPPSPLVGFGAPQSTAITGGMTTAAASGGPAAVRRPVTARRNPKRSKRVCFRRRGRRKRPCEARRRRSKSARVAAVVDTPGHGAGR